MKRASLFLTAALLASPLGLAHADDTTVKITKSAKPLPHLSADEKTSDGSVNAGGQHVDYQAVAGTLVVHPKGWDDTDKADIDGAGKPDEKSPDKSDTQAADDSNPSAEASMFYVAYFKKGAPVAGRPITFLYNGGPGSASVWLHMGAFGPRRVVTLDDSHGPAAPYQFINNDQSLLDVSDLVFIDAPGTGFSRIVGKDREKSFWGIDQDAHAFSDFIAAFLSKYDRWNSPKYLFGESYGTTRSAVLINQLEQDKSVDFNGVILLSQILNFDASVDGPEANPGVDLPYIVALPTYAATAWYHHKLGDNPPDLQSLLKDVESFASTDYTTALQQGAALDPAKRDEIANKLAQYTGLSVDYIKRANLRVDGGEFEKNLQGAETTTGRLDTRFSGPTMDPLSKEADYDPQSAAIGSAYVSVFNDYVRKTLGYGGDKYYKPEIEIDSWDMKHAPFGSSQPSTGSANVMPDLAAAMKYNPKLKVMLNAGYYDLATPYYEGIFEMRHLPMPQALQANIEFKQYASGHMVYAHQAALQQLHDNVADFIRRTEGTSPATGSANQGQAPANTH